MSKWDEMIAAGEYHCTNCGNEILFGDGFGEAFVEGDNVLCFNCSYENSLPVCEECGDHFQGSSDAVVCNSCRETSGKYKSAYDFCSKCGKHIDDEDDEYFYSVVGMCRACNNDSQAFVCSKCGVFHDGSDGNGIDGICIDCYEGF